MNLFPLKIFSGIACMLFCMSSFAQQTSFRTQMLRQIDSLRLIGSHRNMSVINRMAQLPGRITPSKKPDLQKLQKVISSSAVLDVNAETCYDTAGRYFIKDDPRTYYVGDVTLSRDGSILAVGEWALNGTSDGGGFLMKCNDIGNVKWTRLYDSVNHTQFHYINYYHILELKDGSLLLAGSTNDPANDNNDLLLTHTDKLGNIIWTKAYKSHLWGDGNGSASYMDLKALKQDPATGDIFFTAGHWAQGHNVTRVRVLDGSIMWSKYYNYYSFNFDTPFGLDIRNNDLVVFSKFNYDYGGTPTSIHVLNKNTGDTIMTRVFNTADATAFNLGVLHTEDLVKLDNGNYAVTGKQFRFYYSLNDSITDMYHACVEEFDSKFNFVRAYTFRNGIESNLFNTRISLNKDGSGVFSMIKLLGGVDADAYYIQFKNGQILKQRKKEYRNEGMPIENKAVRLPGGKDLIIKLLGDDVTHINKVEFLKLGLRDIASICLGRDDRSTYIEKYFMEPASFAMQSIGSNDFYETTKRALQITNTSFQEFLACSQMSICDTMSIQASASEICSNTPLLVTVTKNLYCGALPLFRYDTAMVESFMQLNDSVFQFVFKSGGSTKIYASIQACSFLQDSISVEIHKSMGQVQLGNDQGICSGSSFLLHAGTGYANYLWQDGSTDSVYFVQHPGTYDVVVSDYCGNVFKDTIVVSTELRKPFELPADTIMCSNDSLFISVPSGFSEYNWTPQYRVNSPHSRSSWISPQKDTMYYVSAQQSPGCGIKDSIRISVKYVPDIDLQGKSGFCLGDSATLDAGDDFAIYKWSTGASTQKIVAKQKGIYFVRATAANGCSAADSITINTFLPPPAGFLGNDTTICDDETCTLQAGELYQSYLWSTNSTNSYIPVSTAGGYWLEVKDENNCIGRDTINVFVKDCLQGFFIPNAFTPGGATRNKTFKPMIFGDLVAYEFVIYNRWGQQVFRTNDIEKGWDGNIASQIQNTDTFTWMCRYQLNGGVVKYEKGTVVLIR